MNVSELRQAIKDWANFEAWSDQLIDSWIEMARQDLSVRMRVAEMIQIDVALISSNRVALPPDWQESDFVRLVGGCPIHYLDRDSFYRLSEKDSKGKFTVSGRYMQLGGPAIVEGTNVELHYFGDLPVLGDDSNWTTTRFLELTLSACLKFAFGFGEDMERAVLMENKVDSMISKANETYMLSKSSGSALFIKSKRSYG